MLIADKVTLQGNFGQGPHSSKKLRIFNSLHWRTFRDTAHSFFLRLRRLLSNLMPPPRRNVSRLRAIAAQRWADKGAHETSMTLPATNTGAPSNDSDYEYYLLVSDDEVI